MSQTLDALHFPLHGNHLIEASAGTGKTWTIAALYVRLVLGHGAPGQAFARPLLPPDILVMTFTRAATRELSDRIRARLLQSARVFRGLEEANDPFLLGLLASHETPPQAREYAAWLLATAADQMDDAAIFTIDAWCQRMLREHAFDSGSLFEESLVADEQALLTQAVQDYWRRECYPLPPHTLAMVLQVWASPEALYKDVKDLLRHDFTWSSPHASLEASCHEQSDRVGRLWAERHRQIEALCSGLTEAVAKHPEHWKANSVSPEKVGAWCRVLHAWGQNTWPSGPPELAANVQNRLTRHALPEARKKAAPAWDTTQAWLSALDWLEDLLADLSSCTWMEALRTHAMTRVQERLQTLKRHSASFGFKDLLYRLEAALQGATGERLRARLQAQYPVALVDEFQDTSPLQYRLFDAIYRVADPQPDRALLLIGDPKQSIYGFRGADIYSYLQARQATLGRQHALDTNHRSTQALVNAVNHLFGQAQERLPDGAFGFAAQGVQTGYSLPFVGVKAQGRAERWQSRPALAALHIVHDPTPRAEHAHHAHLAALCAEQVVAWLNDPETGFDSPAGWARLRPCDIAILVRNAKEAQAVQKALRARAVATVYLSNRESIYQSQEAQDLVYWLQAVWHPQEAQGVRTAFATATLGLSLAELAQLAHDDEVFDSHSQQLHPLQKTWKERGVLAMLRQSLHTWNLAARWLQQDGQDGERRLTNYLHLAELLQEASTQLESAPALIRWLQAQTKAAASQDNDEQVVRLESDADLVQIVTIHKSKGLEYPVVMLPFATSLRSVDKRTMGSVMLRGATGQTKLHLTLENEHLMAADQERLREDLRLLYVALTRARHQLWVGFGQIVKNKHETTAHSAFGHLLGDLGPEGDWAQALTRLAQNCPEIERVMAPETVGLTRLHPGSAPVALQEAWHCTQGFDRRWSVDSYSRLTRSMDRSGVWHRWNEEPESKEAMASLPVRADTRGSVWHGFKRGPQTGNLLHELLETLGQHRFADPRLASPLQTVLQGQCERGGQGAQAEGLLDWLGRLCEVTVPAWQARLPEVDGVNTELEFWLPASALQPQRIGAFCQKHLLPGLPRPALQGSDVHGMLMGFIDLVVEHQGRYWVLDYKSNHLGPDDHSYRPERLSLALLPHRYDVQAMIYLLALHRLLRHRLGADYDPARHLGGALFWFVRGVAAPGHGLCEIRVTPEQIVAFDALLSSPLETEILP